MANPVLYILTLLIAAGAMYAFYRVVSARSSSRQTLSYNLGTHCPEGAADAPCPHCGEVLGSDATEDARQRCENSLRSSSSFQTDIRDSIGLIQQIRWNVVCPSCGEASSYIPQARILLYQGEVKSSDRLHHRAHG